MEDHHNPPLQSLNLERERQSQITSREPPVETTSQQQNVQCSAESLMKEKKKKKKRSRGNRAEQHFRRRLRTKDLDESARTTLINNRCQRNEVKQSKPHICDHAMILGNELLDQVMSMSPRMQHWIKHALYQWFDCPHLIGVAKHAQRKSSSVRQAEETATDTAACRSRRIVESIIHLSAYGKT